MEKTPSNKKLIPYIIIIAIVSFFVYVFSYKEQKTASVKTLMIDSIQVNNYIGENNSGFRSSFIAISFKSDNSKCKYFYLVKNKRKYLFEKYKSKKMDMNEFYLYFKFKDINYSNIGSLNEIVKEYSSIILFKRILAQTNTEKIFFETNVKTKVVYILNGKIVDKNDTLAMDMSIEKPPPYEVYVKKRRMIDPDSSDMTKHSRER